MTLQALAALSLVLGAVLYLGRGFFGSFSGRGGCASGSCGSCPHAGCSVEKFEAIRRALEAERQARA